MVSVRFWVVAPTCGCGITVLPLPSKQSDAGSTPVVRSYDQKQEETFGSKETPKKPTEIPSGVSSKWVVKWKPIVLYYTSKIGC